MIHLMSLMISSLFLICATPLPAHFQLSQEPQDRQAKQNEAIELLAKAQSIEIDFVGNRIFSDQALLEQMRLLPDPNQPGKLKLIEGSAYLDALQDDLERVRFFLGTKGYIQARTGKPSIVGIDGRVRITVPIEEGARYIIGKITVKDAKAFSSQEIVEISGLVSGELIDPRLIQERIYKGLKDAYGDKGYIQASVDFIPDFKLFHPLASQGIVDVTLEVSEGGVFFIRKIDFLGQFPARINAQKQAMLDCLLLREGDVYGRRLLYETLKNLNRLGWFEEVRDKDVIIRTNDRDQTIDIDVVVRECGSCSQQ